MRASGPPRARDLVELAHGFVHDRIDGLRDLGLRTRSLAVRLAVWMRSSAQLAEGALGQLDDLPLRVASLVARFKAVTGVVTVEAL